MSSTNKSLKVVFHNPNTDDELIRYFVHLIAEKYADDFIEKLTKIKQAETE